MTPSISRPKKGQGSPVFLSLRLILMIITLSLVFSCSTTAPGPITNYDPASSVLTPLPDWAVEGGIYEISLRNISQEGDFRGAMGHLPRIAGMGIKTIWLMPFQPIGQRERKGTHGSPYATTDFRSVDPLYGDMGDFAAFRDKVHELGMKLIIDISLGISAWDHPWLTEHPDWYKQDEEGTILPASTWFADVVSLDMSHPEVREELLDVLLFWALEQKVDGFRLDAAGLIEDDFWLWILPQVYAAKPLMLMAETGDANQASAGFNTLYLFDNTIEYLWLQDRPVTPHLTEIETNFLDMSAGIPHLRFLSNHDQANKAAKLPPNAFGSIKGAEAASMITYSFPGIPMVHNGQEVGLATQGDVVDRRVIDWEQNPQAREFFQRYLKIWASEPALRLGNYQPFGQENSPRVAAFTRSFEGDTIAVAVNIADEAVDFTLPTPWVTEQTFDLWEGVPWDGRRTIRLEADSWVLLRY
jgi:glycosidase